jgi:NTE family protein
MANIGLVLSGGGARAAYQVGAIRALSEILDTRTSPFSILTGLSAGAINISALAAGADDFPKAVAHLTEVWMSLTPESVYRTDASVLASLGARWLKDLTTGGLLGASRANYLLDTEPLRRMLTKQMDLSRLKEHFASGVLRGAAVSATNYLTGTIVTFYDGAEDIKPWLRRGRLAQREALSVEHVMASAAIPVFFPPVVVDGRIYGDGGVGMTAPISPAIHLGADKLLAIGIRASKSQEDLLAMNRELHANTVNVAQIGGVLLNALFLDSLDNDLERLQRINRTLGYVPAEARRANPDFLRRIPALSLQPSVDLGQLASDQYEKFPAMLRHMLRGIGATGASGWDLLSYVAFQPGYVSKLIELGFNDTIARRREIELFMSQPIDSMVPAPPVTPSAATS